jgi:membrane fusion protein (multidrug efflux system)
MGQGRAPAPASVPAEARLEGPTDLTARPEKRPAALLGGILLIALLAGGGLYYWLSTRNVESTDDAFTDGRAVTIAPQVSGTVVSLDVTDNEFVSKGQPLIHIDPRQYTYHQAYAQGVLDIPQKASLPH